MGSDFGCGYAALRLMVGAVRLMEDFVQPGQQSHESFSVPGASGAFAEVRYLLFLPHGYQSGGKDWPLLLFLHGAGERGTDLEVVKKHGPPKVVESNRDFPFIVVSPQCPSNERWQPSVLLQLMDHLVATHRVDPKRIYVTGLSMGGYATWSLCTTAPERFAAAVPICGGGKATEAIRLKDLPLWVFHGAHDPIVSLHQSEEMVQAVQSAGGNVKFTVYTEGGHDSWSETYANQAVFDWLLEQRQL